MIFATVWTVACVRRDPEIFSRDLRIVTQSVYDFQKLKFVWNIDKNRSFDIEYNSNLTSRFVFHFCCCFCCEVF